MIIRIKQFGLRDYIEVWEAMREFTETRGGESPDEIWLVEHPPVYTLGRNGDPAHILVQTCCRSGVQPATNPDRGLNPVVPTIQFCSWDPFGAGNALSSLPERNIHGIRNLAEIPVVKTDRGGQVTYHGPGQLVIYALFDLNRLGIGVRTLVTGLENAAIWALSQYGVKANSRPDAPGAYVDGKKIASLGLRIRKGCSYHGLSLNVDIDLAPFSAINPCGYPGLQVTQLADLGVAATPLEVAVPLIGGILKQFGWEGVEAG